MKVVAVNGNKVTFAADDVQYAITLAGDDYTVNGSIVKSAAGSLHVYGTTTYYHNDALVYKNVRVDSHLIVASELDVEELVNYGNIRAAATIDGEISNNGNIQIAGQYVELKIVAGEGYIWGNEAILTSKVTITGGNQSGSYNSTTGFENTEDVAELSWVNQYNTAADKNVVLTNEIVETLTNIITYVISGLNFNEKSIDLTGKTFVVESTEDVVIAGNGTYHTEVTGLNIVNEVPNANVKLYNVKATGTYVVGTEAGVTYGKLYTTETATWNGKKVNK